ncbi:hypothetical protein M0805_002636 [Coniferiporia weirii]|nr:hypothetical protein M0805_002636 [Coniferiporia weirii]
MGPKAKEKRKDIDLGPHDADETEYETQGFEPKEEDSDDLWDVVEILAEKSRTYLIKWAGADPEGNPWPDSWVPRQDVTDDLVSEWKAKKAAKRKIKRRKSKDLQEWKRTGSTTTMSTRTSPGASTRESTSIKPESTSTTEGARLSSAKGKKRPASEVEDIPADTERSPPPGLPRKKRRIGGGKWNKREEGEAPFKQSKQNSPPIYDDNTSDKQMKTRPRNILEESEPTKRQKSSLDAPQRKKLRRNAGADLSLAQETRAEEEEEEEEGSARHLKSKPSLPSGNGVDKLANARPPSAQSNPPHKKQRSGSSSKDLTQHAKKDLQKEKEVPKSIYDTPPTPPRRTNFKSRRTGVGTAATAPSKSAGRDQRSGIDEINKEPLERPGPTLSTAQEGKGTTTNDVGLTEARSPSLGIDYSSLRPSRGHSGDRTSAPVSTAPMSKVSSSNHVDMSDQEGAKNEADIIITKGFSAISRTKRKGKVTTSGSGEEAGDSSSERGPSPRSRAGSLSVVEQDNDEERGRRNPTIPVPRSPPSFLPDYDQGLPQPDLPNDLRVDDGDDRTSESNPHDRQPPFVRKAVSASAAAVDGLGKDGKVNANKIGDKDAVQSQLTADMQGPISTVIPATQSQSQSQTTESVQFDSTIAEHGSSAPRAEVDLSMVAATPVSSLDVEAESIEVASPPVATLDSSVNTNGRAKALKPIPMISPSKFQPHLPAFKPLSSMPLAELRQLPLGGRDADPLAGSADDQESPVKDFDVDARGKKQRSGERHTSSVNTDDDDDIEDSMVTSFELRQRGLELAEIHRQKELMLKRELASKYVPLDELLELAGPVARHRAGSGERTGGSLLGVIVHPLHLAGRTDDNDSLSSSLYPDREGVDDEALVRQLEREYIDFDGNAGEAPDGPSKSGQGVLDDEQRSVSSEIDPQEEADVESSLHGGELADENGPVDDDPFIANDDGYSREATPTTTTSQQDVVITFPDTPARFKILGSPHKLDVDVVETPMRQLNSALGLLNRKSEEITALKALNTEGEKERLAQSARIAALEGENAALSKFLESRPQPDAPPNVDEGEHNALKQAHASVLEEREAFLAEISLLKMARSDAEKDVEFFRELYGKASSFADEVRRENVELSDRATLAEGQLSKGLELIRAQGAAKVRKLSEELDKSKLLLGLLREKDQRTDDEIRRRAAREAELQPLIDELYEEKKEMKRELSAVVRQRNELMVQNKDVKEELDHVHKENLVMQDTIDGLRVQVFRLAARERSAKRIFQQTSAVLDDDGDGEVSSRDPGEEDVYVCGWAVDDTAERCGEILLSQQDLRDHLFVENHL